MPNALIIYGKEERKKEGKKTHFVGQLYGKAKQNTSPKEKQKYH